MKRLKQIIKKIFIKTNTLLLLDTLNYSYSKLKYFSSNRTMKKKYPDFPFPPDYYLYETYILDYKEYKADGEITANEIIEWTKKYVEDNLIILEWGCGVARIIRHIPNLLEKNSIVIGTDINKEMIDWNSCNIANVNFIKINYLPPTHFDKNQFNLVFALSVFTHIEANVQIDWVAEIARIISDNGIFIFTTHGKKFNANLNNQEKLLLQVEGALTINYKQKGHRMMTSYNEYENFKNIIQKYFEILEYYNGEEYPDKTGGQDLWIVKKLKKIITHF